MPDPFAWQAAPCETDHYDPEIRQLQKPPRRFTIVHPLILAFFSADLYRDAGRNWRGASFAYLLLLSLISTVPWLMRAQAAIDIFVTEHTPGIIEQVPDITITGGEVRIDAEQPYFIEDPETGKTLFILDTTGTMTSLQDTEAQGLLTDRNFLHRQREWEIRTYDLSEIESFELNREILNEWAEIGRKWLVFFLFPFVLVFTFAVGTILVLLYAGLGNLFCNATRITLSYPALVSIAVMALTPAWLLGILFGLLRIEVPFWWLVSFLISMSYLYLGVRASGPQPDGEAGIGHPG
jgi:hypothetical protein